MDSQPKGRATPPDVEMIDDEAIEWLTCLNDRDRSPEDPYYDSQVRSRAFLQWVSRSPFHLRTFMEIFEVDYRMKSLDFSACEDIPTLIASLQEDEP
jgi:Domain of unknown function (DUF4880)